MYWWSLSISVWLMGLSWVIRIWISSTFHYVFLELFKYALSLICNWEPFHITYSAHVQLHALLLQGIIWISAGLGKFNSRNLSSIMRRMQKQCKILICTSHSAFANTVCFKHSDLLTVLSVCFSPIRSSTLLQVCCKSSCLIRLNFQCVKQVRWNLLFLFLSVRLFLEQTLERLQCKSVQVCSGEEMKRICLCCFFPSWGSHETMGIGLSPTSAFPVCIVIPTGLLWYW